MLWIIFTCIIASGLVILLVLYAFVYEITNFRLSKVNIFISDKRQGESVPPGERAPSDNLRQKADNSKLDEPSKYPYFMRFLKRQKADNSKLDEPAGEPVLTILHLSDFHLRRNFKGKKLSEFVRNLSRLEPDFIFITGDLLGGNSMDNLIDMLSPLRAKLAKYAVLGVHDHYDKAFVEFVKNMFKRKREYKKENDISYLTKRLKDIGIEVLINESRSPDRGSNVRGIDNIEIIGLGDPVINKIDIDKAFSKSIPEYNEYKDLHLQNKANCKCVYKDVFKLDEKKVHSINEKGKLRIALIHTPDTDSIISLAKRNTDIIFCGHTHGGQVRLPFIGAIISGCKIKTKFASGLFYFKNIVLYVTRGLGEGKYSQFRFYCQPEAGLVNIYKID